MAQGLFTAGTSVEELLAKRNTRANALQQSLMANAAQGAARPMEAQAYSLLGSSLGRALAGKMGGEDKEMEALKARETSEAGLVKEYATAASGTDVAAMYRSANNMIQTGDPKAIQMGSSLLQRADQLSTKQADEVAATEKASIQKRNNNRIADLVEEDMPVVAANARENDPIALKAAYAHQQAKVKNKGKSEEGTATEQNYIGLSSATKALNARAALDPNDPEYLNSAQLASKIRIANNVFGVSDSSYQKEMGKGMAAQIVKLTGDNNKNLEADNDARTLIDSSIALLDSGELYTGQGGELYLNLQKTLAVFGAPVNLQSMAAGEAFRSKAMSFVLQYISQTKGAISNAEMKKFEAAAMGLGNTELGNRLILDAAKQANTFKREQATYMGDWFDEKGSSGTYPTPNEYATEQRKWQDANRIVLKTPSEIKALSENLAVVSDSDEEVVVVNDALSRFNADFAPDEED